ncbi:MAG: hypothetical protein EZS28_000672 [Streblomastix strix]|uniref:Uncharacterized protein n=1 Tax=Streblomastix strix TaxID=222440 RepID=A0A5J4X9C3_9EUKA|nr:MAG: hypothetical protein EZS28_000672 [Streblomastix strix]
MGSFSGEMLQNDECQLFIDNDNALVYAANNQIVDGYATDYALKIAPNGLLTIKNLKVINIDLVAQINQLINEVNQLQSPIGGVNDDFVFSAESGTVWMYEISTQGGLSEQSWYNSGDIVPDQVTPASDATPSNCVANGSARTSNEYERGDHQHPLQISTVLPTKDIANGEAGVATTYSRSYHTHHVNLSNDVPLKDTGTGTACTANIYASATHQHPLNVDPTTAYVLQLNTTAAANGTSDIYSRNDHVHPQQLIYDGNITATKFIKTRRLATEVLCANGDTKYINGVKRFGKTQANLNYNEDMEGFIYNYKPCIFINERVNKPTALFYVEGVNKTADLQVRLLKYCHEGQITQTIELFNQPECISDILTSEPVDQTPTDFTTQFTQNDSIQINSTATSYDDGLRIARSGENSGNSSIQLGSSRTYNTDAIVGQWSIFTPPNTAISNPQSFVIALASQAGDNTRGLQISADGQTLAFNGNGFVDIPTDQTITGIKTYGKLIQVNPTTNGTFNEGIRIRYEGWTDRGLLISADGNILTFKEYVIAGGSVNYSQVNPIVWNIKSLGTDGGFYSDGTTVFWRDHTLQFDPNYQNQ